MLLSSQIVRMSLYSTRCRIVNVTLLHDASDAFWWKPLNVFFLVVLTKRSGYNVNFGTKKSVQVDRFIDTTLRMRSKKYYNRHHMGASLCLPFGKSPTIKSRNI